MLEWLKKFFIRVSTMLKGSKQARIPFAPGDITDILLLGDSAQRLLENKALEASFRRIEEDYFRMWRNSKPLDTEGREAIWQGLQAISELKLKLNRLVNDMVVEKQAVKETKKQSGGI